jgi:hypothetical protein
MLTRRQLLKTSAAAAGALAVAPAARAAVPDRRTKHVVFIAMAGGVRTRETLGSPENVPNLVRLGEEGVVLPRVRSANLGHFGATMSLFTGISEARGIRDNERGPDPTLFEYVRKDLDLPPSSVWVSTSGGAQQTNYSHGTHPDYGAAYGANTLDGDGIFNREFRRLLDRYGRPRRMESGEEELLERMRGSLADGGEGGAENAALVERYILEELTRGTSDLRGAGAADAKALRVARNLLSLFRPTLTSVVLQDADVAHGSFNAYVEVIRRNDAAIGEIVEVIRADAALRDSTTIVVVPEFGRDRDLNARRGLDHGDGSDDLNYVAAVAWGPDFGRGKVLGRDVRAIDLCPTVCSLVGASARHARGSRIGGLIV